MAHERKLQHKTSNVGQSKPSAASVVASAVSRVSSTVQEVRPSTVQEVRLKVSPHHLTGDLDLINTKMMDTGYRLPVS